MFEIAVFRLRQPRTDLEPNRVSSIVVSLRGFDRTVSQLPPFGDPTEVLCCPGSVEQIRVLERFAGRPGNLAIHLYCVVFKEGDPVARVVQVTVIDVMR